MFIADPRIVTPDARRRNGYMPKSSSISRPNRIAEHRKARKLTQQKLAELVEAHWTTISDLERGTQQLTQDWMRRLGTALEVRPSEFLVEDDGASTSIPIRGLVGAGGEIVDDIAQVHRDGAVCVVVDIALPDGLSAFEVWGGSMLPKYDPGDVIIVSDTAVPASKVLGDVALVRTIDGRRYLKRVLKGSAPGYYNLESFNAQTMEDEEIAEAAPILMIVPAKQVVRLEQHEAPSLHPNGRRKQFA